MSVNEKMTAIADAIRACTGKTDKLGLDGMIKDLAEFVGFELLPEHTVPGEGQTKLDRKLTVLAYLIRNSVPDMAWFQQLSLNRMRHHINTCHSFAEARVGMLCYRTLGAALSNAKDGDTVTLLKDVVLGAGVVLEKSIAIEGNGHRIKTTFNNYLFDLKTTNEGAFLKLMNVDVTHSHMVANVDSGYYADITIENATFTGLYHFVYFRGGSAGFLKINKVTADMGGTAICVLSGSNDVSIIDSTITAAGHAVQVEHSGSTVIEGSTVQSSQKDFTIVYRAPDSATTLTIKNSTVENNSTDDGLGVAIFAPYGRGGVILSGDAFLTGKIDMLSKVFSTLDFDYSGYGFMVRNDGTCFYFCETLGDAISKCEQYDAAIMYAITESAKTVAENAGYSVVLDGGIGYYIIS